MELKQIKQEQILLCVNPYFDEIIVEPIHNHCVGQFTKQKKFQPN